ncbi:MAG: hypothetical protein KF775_05705 [Cyclobacteriaceae bacterium]|nr:hypothetical protein [Cyclobacteriaceae bacterium]
MMRTITLCWIVLFSVATVSVSSVTLYCEGAEKELTETNEARTEGLSSNFESLFVGGRKVNVPVPQISNKYRAPHVTLAGAKSKLHPHFSKQVSIPIYLFKQVFLI